MQCLVFRNLSLKKQRINFENSICITRCKRRHEFVEWHNLYVTYSALLGVSDNIIKIMPVHKNRDFLAVRMCELWVPV